MRLSQLFFTTLRDDPADAEMPSHRLLQRAGYVRQLGSGIYSLLPLGFRVNKRVEQIIREEMDRIGSQEIEMPVVHPADVWRLSGRYDAIGPEMGRFKDRNGRDMVLAMTHEEVVALLLADVVKSYRQLPMMVYHFQTKWRDEPRARGGLIRVREFVMKDAYSCDRDEAGLDVSYWAQHGAYVRIFERLGLETIAVSSDVGMMGGSQAHEFMVLNPAGEDVLVLCESCDYAANRQVAVIPREVTSAEAALPLEEIETPGTTTIASLAAFLGVGADRTAKAAFFVAGDGRLITAIVRGDHEVNETKLVNATGATGGLRPATVEEIKAAGMEPGYGSPIGARGTTVVIDTVVAASSNLVAGANREGFHFKKVNAGRDFTADVVADLNNAQEGDPCPNCGQPVILRNGIEVGNIFKLGTKYTVAAEATYLAEDGVARPIVMGSYGIGIGRNVACIVEAHHDDKGIIWPAEVAPYAAHLVSIGAAKEPQVLEIAERLHAFALDAGHEILWDDRDESPGVKFTDAELLGMPWILTVSPRSLAAGGVEVTNRATGERATSSIEDVEALLRGWILPKVRDPRFITVRRGGTLQDDDHRLLALWAADCAEHVVLHFEAERPHDDRPRRAIELGRAWARGEIPWSEARTAAGHANGAARDLKGAARHAAYAAAQAAAVGHVAAHELGAAAYAIRAVRASVPDAEAEAAGAAEREWQRAQLPEAIRDLVLDDQRLRNELCWFVFEP